MKDDSKETDGEHEEQDEQEGVVESSKAADARRAHSADEDEDEDEDEDDDAAPRKASVTSKAPPKSKRSKKARAAARAAKARTVSASPSASGSTAGALVGLALIAGAAAGWFAHRAAGKPVNSEVHAASAGESACAAWSKQVCDGAGAQSAACTQAKSASEILSETACTAALSDVPATLEKAKAARADCDKLVGKLCTDLGKQTNTCKMVTERTASFPPDRCKEMLTNYDKVLGQLKTMEQRGGPGNPHGGGMAPRPPGAGPTPGMPGHGGIRLTPTPPGGTPPGAPQAAAGNKPPPPAHQ